MLAESNVIQIAQHRATRYQPQAFFNSSDIALQIDGMPVTLTDVSNSGIAFYTENPAALTEQPARVQLLNRNVSLLDSPAIFVRQEKLADATKIALAFTTPIDCQELLFRQRFLSLAPLSPAEDPTPESYKVFCQDILVLLRTLRQLCQDYERQQRDFDLETEHQTLLRLRRFLMPHWQEIMRRGNAFLAAYQDDLAALKALKHHAEMVLTPEFMGAPGWQRSFSQPRGYPGDYGVMEFIYQPAPFGQALYDKVLHAFGQELGAFVRNRLQIATALLQETAATAPAGEPLRITNFGCGSAREIAAFLQSGPVTRPITFHLIDQDPEALQYAATHLRPHLAGQPLVTVVPYALNLLEGYRTLERLPPQHLIYSLGVMDYLKDSAAQRFVARFYAALAPGGQLLVANLSQIPDRPEWLFTNLFNWKMLYRSADDLAALAAPLPGASAAVFADDSGFVALLRVTKGE
jgi:extracellular factor (EF) 3-hydroxypalmitic acid methyl ester biosynthesis protein